MSQSDEIKIQTDYLIARMDALEQVLCATITTLTEQQQNIIMTIAEQYADRQAEHARAIGTEIASDRSLAAFEISEKINKAVDYWGKMTNKPSES